MKIETLIIYLFVLLVSGPFYNNSYAQSNLPLADKVTFGESQTRYYLHYDRNGNSPENLGIDRLANSIRAGDEIVVRFYPSMLFAIDPVRTNKLEMMQEDSLAKIIYPSVNTEEGCSVQEGYGTLYFISNGDGLFRLRISDKPADVKIYGDIEYSKIVKEIVKDEDESCDGLNSIIDSKKFLGDWRVRIFKDVLFENGMVFPQIVDTEKKY